MYCWTKEPDREGKRRWRSIFWTRCKDRKEARWQCMFSNACAGQGARTTGSMSVSFVKLPSESNGGRWISKSTDLAGVCVFFILFFFVCMCLRVFVCVFVCNERWWVYECVGPHSVWTGELWNMRSLTCPPLTPPSKEVRGSTSEVLLCTLHFVVACLIHLNCNISASRRLLQE